jgi:hypothetical protein
MIHGSVSRMKHHASRGLIPGVSCGCVCTNATISQPRCAAAARTTALFGSGDLEAAREIGVVGEPGDPLLTDRERRLVKLFTFGEVDEQVVRDQIADIRREQCTLQDRLRIGLWVAALLRTIGPCNDAAAVGLLAGEEREHRRKE